MGRVEQVLPAGKRAAARTPASRVTAIALAALALLLLPGSLVLDALAAQNLAENGAQDVIVFASAVTVGLVLAWHRPGNAIGWLLLAGVDVQGLGIDGSVYDTLARIIDEGTTLILVEEVPDQALELSDRIVEVRNGQGS